MSRSIFKHFFTRPCSETFLGSLIVAWSQLDDMCSSELVVSVQLGIVVWWFTMVHLEYALDQIRAGLSFLCWDVIVLEFDQQGKPGNKVGLELRLVLVVE